MSAKVGNYTYAAASTSSAPQETSDRTQVYYEPKESITDQKLLRQGYKARARVSAPMQKRERERLDPSMAPYNGGRYLADDLRL